MVTATSALQQGHKESFGGGGPASDREKPALTSRRLAGFFFWTGIAMSVCSLTWIVYREATLVWPWEQGSIPLSCLFAAAAAFAFLAAEIVHIRANKNAEREFPPVGEKHKAGWNSELEFRSFTEQEFEQVNQENRSELDI
jgi:hypothetical protein